MAITQEVPVDGLLVNGLSYPVDTIHLLVEYKCVRTIATTGQWRLVDNAPTGTRQQTILQFLALVITNLSVEGASCTLQVHRIVLTRIPQHGATVKLHRDVEHLGRWLATINHATYLIFKCQGRCLDFKITILLYSRKGRNG